MLEVGNGGLTVEEERSHFSLWCMLAAPLITGNDLSTMNATTKEILTNKEVIDVDQDILGKQGYKILDGFEIEIFMKPLAKGDTAICVFNRSDKVKEVDVKWSDYKIGPDFRIRDLWLHQEIGTTAVNFKASIPVHGVRVFRLSKK